MFDVLCQNKVNRILIFIENLKFCFRINEFFRHIDDVGGNPESVFIINKSRHVGHDHQRLLRDYRFFIVSNT